MAEIVSVLSGKGGGGKTLIAINMAVYLAALDKKVLILDGNFESRGVDVALGMESQVIYDIADVVKGNCRIRQAITKSKEFNNLYIMEPPLLKKECSVSVMELSVLIDRIREKFDYIIIDSPSGLNRLSELYGRKADRILMVTTQEPECLRSGQSLLRSIKENCGTGTGTQIGLLINMVRLKLADNGYFQDVEDIAESFGLDVCGVLPYDESMNVAFNNGVPSISLKNTAAAEHLKRVMQRFLLTE